MLGLRGGELIRRIAPVVFLVLGLGAVVYSLLGDESYPRLRQLRSTLQSQKRTNAELREKVLKLRHEVRGLESDDRLLEKAARNELGMARPGERIFVFEKARGEAPDPR